MTLPRLLLPACLLLASLSSARAEYAAQRGDVLDVMVSSAPTLNRRVTVDDDGNVTLPLLGQVRATETDLAELGRRILALLSARNVVHRGSVIVSVAEYGPIYVDGDVARPGEYRYRPGLTVRGAISLAGGLDTTRGLGRLSPGQVSDARADYGATAIELARQEARIARLDAVLSGAAELDPARVTASPGIPATIIRDIVAAEARQMDADRRTRANEKADLERLLAAAREEVRLLELAEVAQQANYDQVVGEAGRAGDLLQRGVVNANRTEAAARSLAQARAQVLDVQVRLAQARSVVEERVQQLGNFENQRRANLLEAQRDAVAEAGKARFRLQAARERGANRPNASAEDGSPSEPATIVRRIVNGATQRLPSELDMALRPGDSVEVVSPALRTEGGSLPAQPVPR